MGIKDQFPEMTELERACKLLDELLCLFGVRDHPLGASCMIEAMEMIADARKNNPEYPITLWLVDRMKERGLLPD